MPSNQSQNAAGEVELLTASRPPSSTVPMTSGDRDREAGDGDVVEDLADRLGERPAVGEVHERAVDGVQQRHPGGEQHRQAEDRVPGQPGAGGAAGEDEQGDLGRGVEAEAEQQADGYICPGLVIELA